jgi:hypothetical protein
MFITTDGKKLETSCPVDIFAMRRFRPSSFLDCVVDLSAASSSRRSSSI